MTETDRERRRYLCVCVSQEATLPSRWPAMVRMEHPMVLLGHTMEDMTSMDSKLLGKGEGRVDLWLGASLHQSFIYVDLSLSQAATLKEGASSSSSSSSVDTAEEVAELMATESWPHPQQMDSRTISACNEHSLFLLFCLHTL